MHVTTRELPLSTSHHRRSQHFLCGGARIAWCDFEVWLIKLVVYDRFETMLNGKGRDPENFWVFFVWKWHFLVHFLAHDACNSGILSSQTAQICLMFQSWGHTRTCPMHPLAMPTPHTLRFLLVYSRHVTSTSWLFRPERIPRIIYLFILFIQFISPKLETVKAICTK